MTADKGPSRVLTVIVNWRSSDMTLQATKAALAAMADVSGDITIVDNDSGDGSFSRMKSHVAEMGWSRVRVVQSGRNGGFGAGNNVGIRAGLHDGSRPDYVFVLNSDAFPEMDAIRILVDYLDTHPEAGFAGSYLHGDDGSANVAGARDHAHLSTFRFPSILSEFEGAIAFGPVSRLFKNHAVTIPIPAATRPVDWLAGAAVMVRQSVLDAVGLFDERFFLYFEETDLCLRAAKKGYQTHYVRDSRVIHIGSQSTGMKEWDRVPDYWFDSRLHYFVKNHGAFYAGLATLAHLTGGFLHWLRCVVAGRARNEPPHFLRTMAIHDLRALFRPRAVHDTRQVSAE